jgi:hypothetical protein
MSNSIPFRELTVSVVQVTHSHSSEPLEQPNFDILRHWAQGKTLQDDVIQHHLHLESALDPQFEQQKDLEMDCLRMPIKSQYEQLKH